MSEAIVLVAKDCAIGEHDWSRCSDSDAYYCDLCSVKFSGAAVSRMKAAGVQEYLKKKAERGWWEKVQSILFM